MTATRWRLVSSAGATDRCGRLSAGRRGSPGLVIRPRRGSCSGVSRLGGTATIQRVVRGHEVGLACDRARSGVGTLIVYSLVRRQCWCKRRKFPVTGLPRGKLGKVATFDRIQKDGYAAVAPETLDTSGLSAYGLNKGDMVQMRLEIDAWDCGVCTP